MGAPEHFTDRDVTEALAALPDITAAEVAGALGIGRSTAAKRLARLEAAGVVRRTPGGRVGGTKVADRWSLATPHEASDPDADVTSTPVSAGDPGATADGDAAQDIAQEIAQVSDAHPLTEDSARDSVDGADDAGTSTTETRLSPGGLRALVRDYLAARPGQSFGPSGIATSLGRSAGAVSNALSALAETGEVRLVAEHPRRYRISPR
jgi:DNA-binding MarR family transcriptional regulator